LDVETAIAHYQPHIVAVELDEGRLQALDRRDPLAQTDLVTVLRSGRFWQLIGRLVLAYQQRTIAQQTGTQPGAELARAVALANEEGRQLVCVDRPIDITLQRAWRLTPFWEKIRALVADDGQEAVG